MTSTKSYPPMASTSAIFHLDKPARRLMGDRNPVCCNCRNESDFKIFDFDADGDQIGLALYSCDDCIDNFR